jgi:hypothetical protein
LFVQIPIFLTYFYFSLYIRPPRAAPGVLLVQNTWTKIHKHPA